MKPTRSELRRIVTGLRVPPGSKVSLPSAAYSPGATPSGLTAADAAAALEELRPLLDDYQQRLAAEATRGLLIVVQGLDASGKDGIVRNVMSGLNPAGVAVHSFKVPSSEELAHDFLWRYANRVPRRGEIAIFNRSHYEEVLVVRVHPENLERQNLADPRPSDALWERRFRDINAWERYLDANGIHVVKFFLNISKDEQRRRFLDRIDQPDRNWKFSAADIRERQSWDDYQTAFAATLSTTSTRWAPWYVIPADHKWFARLAVAAVIVEELRKIDPQFPAVSAATKATLQAARDALAAEGPAPLPPAAPSGRGL